MCFQFCIFTNEMKENESAVILNLLKHKWEPGLMYYFYSFLFQCKWFDLSMGTSIKYSHSNVGIFRHFLPIVCFKTIEWHHKSKMYTFLALSPLKRAYFIDCLYAKSHLVPAFIYLKGANLQNLILCLVSILILLLEKLVEFNFMSACTGVVKLVF